MPTIGQYAPAWPKGTRQRLNRKLAKRFFDLMSTSEKSLFGLLCDHPELPPHDQLANWRRRHSWFSQAWSEARRHQGEFLAQKTLDFAHDCTPENAHAQRLKADVYWKIASKFFPAVYGDKPAVQSQTTVSIGVVLSEERLSELRSKLDPTRVIYATPQKLSNHQSHLESNPLTVSKP